MTEREDFEQRVTNVYAEQVSGLRQQLAAVDRNVMTYILDGRERGKQIEAIAAQLGTCATELGQLKQIKGWQRGIVIALVVLAVGVGALLVKVF